VSGLLCEGDEIVSVNATAINGRSPSELKQVERERVGERERVKDRSSGRLREREWERERE